ncbi:hypothetical protein ACH4U3_30250 [Streptomyces griseoruber]|uniref:hypothetical protein n=1 Tax=Streptomyces griseoruber TaxID=1943 RepID=UPI003791A647
MQELGDVLGQPKRPLVVFAAEPGEMAIGFRIGLDDLRCQGTQSEGEPTPPRALQERVFELVPGGGGTGQTQVEDRLLRAAQRVVERGLASQMLPTNALGGHFFKNEGSVFEPRDDGPVLFSIGAGVDRKSLLLRRKSKVSEFTYRSLLPAACRSDADEVS